MLYFSRTKSNNEALKILKQFNADYLVRIRARGVINNQLQSDNGEFASAKVNNYCAEIDVHQRYTATYHSSSNGRAERAIENVKAVGRVLLGHAGLTETTGNTRRHVKLS